MANLFGEGDFDNFGISQDVVITFDMEGLGWLDFRIPLLENGESVWLFVTFAIWTYLREKCIALRRTPLVLPI